MMAPNTPIPAARAGAGVPLAELMGVLAAEAPRLIGDSSVRLLGVHQDSRRVEPGDLFVARSGGKVSGASFAQAAVERGAAALIVERGAPLPALSVPMLEVADARRSLALAAETVYGNPSRALALVGITGTNGKTTTSWLVERALSGVGAKPARLGTVGFAFGGESVDSALTTPEADDISRYAARTRDAGGTHFVMEVSSIALSLDRVRALHFKVAAFSNLTQDHLDFHASFAEYGETKARLFTDLSPEVSVLNVDDSFGERLAKRTHGQVLRVSKRTGADLYPKLVTVDARGIRGTIHTPSGEVALESRLVGEHNLENLLLALGILQGLGVDLERAARALGDAPQVPGRLERCDEPGDDILVLVDYAHTPDALERVLVAARSMTKERVLCVFGCGGDRDPQKRPRMGAAVGRLADYAWLTNDNPRSEEPSAIAKAVEVGLREMDAKYEVELDRARAIELAVCKAQPGDVVLVAGKGHEPYQLIGDQTLPFDDRVEARRALSARRERGGTWQA
ncbi:MAG TPA: UDP-N-acetylmuramoyl-L-alanyl-D-glutamate--2,6-diaminopimelate ligase [Polyangiaceae bacterium]|jgi:UDP-N-acetylmuramoyl-L-alanyl-D-glutamate--2,6-diaminopimelate ligase|nr:UDP-N-acetylmuramoyl-L-alanyl-D-glutamate--2,6-diaminopimelate ligase [Polyangiaceae bacterium]